MGCPFDCIYCNQKSISGQSEEMNRDRMKSLLDSHLNTIDSARQVEIGFYGGSFTGIPEEKQIILLETASDYLKKGIVHRIRLSTRPDIINKEVLKRLSNYGVGLIELGVQSLDDTVLAKSLRGHTVKEVYNAVMLIKESGINLGIQTMTALPGDTKKKSIQTALKVADLNPETVRIYPTIVLKGTVLERLFNKRKYVPPTLDETVETCAILLDIYENHGINVIRIGLQPTDMISTSGHITAGPFHPAIRHLVETMLMRNRLEQKLKVKKVQKDAILTIITSSRNMANIIGYRKKNKQYFREKYGFIDVKIVCDTEMNNYEFRIMD